MFKSSIKNESLKSKFSFVFICCYFLEILDGIKEKAPKHQIHARIHFFFCQSGSSGYSNPYIFVIVRGVGDVWWGGWGPDPLSTLWIRA